MNHRFQLRHLLAATAALLGSVTSALAYGGLAGGGVALINTISSETYPTLTIVAASSATDAIIATGTIDNNSDHGWKLTVASTNHGILKRTTGTGDSGTLGVGTEILYTNIKLVKTSGTLGAGLTDPAGVPKDISDNGGTPGTIIFNTGASVGSHGTATTATCAYVYALKINYAADTTLLQGTYSDTLTLTLDVDT